jgi:hypothetical protein
MPVMGVDTEVKREAVDLGFNVGMSVVLTLVGTKLGSMAAPKETTKGAIIGGAIGFLTYLLMGQKLSLERIADHTQELKRMR